MGAGGGGEERGRGVQGEVSKKAQEIACLFSPSEKLEKKTVIKEAKLEGKTSVVF